MNPSQIWCIWIHDRNDADRIADVDRPNYEQHPWTSESKDEAIARAARKFGVAVRADVLDRAFKALCAGDLVLKPGFSEQRAIERIEDIPRRDKP